MPIHEQRPTVSRFHLETRMPDRQIQPLQHNLEQ